MTLAIFSAFGYSPVRTDKLNSFDKVSATNGADMLMNMPGRSSLPVDFFGFIFYIRYLPNIRLTSAVVKLVKRRKHTQIAIVSIYIYIYIKL